MKFFFEIHEVAYDLTIYAKHTDSEKLGFIFPTFLLIASIVLWNKLKLKIRNKYILRIEFKIVDKIRENSENLDRLQQQIDKLKKGKNSL